MPGAADDEELQEDLIQVCKMIHRQAEEEAIVGRASKTSHSYVTSVSFIDFLRSFVQLRSSRARDLDGLIRQLRVCVCALPDG